jgi:hypothetical protein
MIDIKRSINENRLGVEPVEFTWGNRTFLDGLSVKISKKEGELLSFWLKSSTTSQRIKLSVM